MNRILIFVAPLVAVLSLASPALSEVYQCSIKSQYSNGWLLPGYILEHEAGSKTIKFTSLRSGGTALANGIGKVTADNSKKLSGSFVWKGATTQSGQKINVRYSATVYKANGKFQVSVVVGTHGQREFGRGACKRIS